ncbi:hypothetical protein QFC20_001720 [Naganishia adeliensis]|uniref:Uncharacterized protein n=1 Tax=Naganishia adeliensis TaxID=92952 RepID=A0ACC2WR22_9TREE|nr:hypothetical protein QFC20_001720 [Naganishia adeliensis]
MVQTPSPPSGLPESQGSPQLGRCGDHPTLSAGSARSSRLAVDESRTLERNPWRRADARSTHESEVAPGDSTLRQAGPGYGQGFMLPATMQLFIKGMDLRPLVRTRHLSRHWLEFVSPDSRTKTTGEELKGHLDAPMRTLPDCFMEVIREHYRNAIVERIGGKPLDEILQPIGVNYNGIPTLSGTRRLPPPESRPDSQTDEPIASTASLSCESMVASARETGGLATGPSLPLAGHHFSHSVSLPATSQLFIKGMDLNSLVKQSKLSRHWLEVVPPANRMTNTWQELGLRDLDAPIRTPPLRFMKLILEHYRNAILKRIGLNPLNEVLSDKLASKGTSLSSRNLYSTKRPIPDKRDLEAFLKPYFDRAGTFSVEISKEKVWEHGQWVWKMRSTTVDCNESEH